MKVTIIILMPIILYLGFLSVMLLISSFTSSYKL